MFEDMTYENILNNMLSRVTNDVDKREGSVIYDALAPCAYQLAQTYFKMNNFLDLVSGDTAVGEYLDRVVKDYGITRKPATSAVRRIVTTGAVDVGSRWGLGETTYCITAKLSEYNYSAVCEQTGSIGNIYAGVLENIDNINGITATLTDILTSGEDEENDDNLRARFYTQIQSAATSGNADDYRNWALDVPGCGDAKVYPLWNGPGTVKVLVVDENMEIDNTLPDKVYDYIEKVRPIGATVSVVNPESLLINISVKVVLNGTKTLDDVKAAFTESLRAYLKDTVFEIYSVSYAKIGSLLLSTAGVEDYNTLLLNDSTDNIVIGDTELPICNTVVLAEV